MADLDEHLPGTVAREESAFVAWLAGAEPALRGALRRFAASVDVEAVLQEALLRIWIAAPRHRPDGAENSLLRLAHRIAQLTSPVRGSDGQHLLRMSPPRMHSRAAIRRSAYAPPRAHRAQPDTVDDGLREH